MLPLNERKKITGILKLTFLKQFIERIEKESCIFLTEEVATSAIC